VILLALIPYYEVQIRRRNELGQFTDSYTLYLDNVISISINKSSGSIARTATIEVPNTDYLHLLHSKLLLKPYDLVRIVLGYENALNEAGTGFVETKRTVFSGYIINESMPFSISGQTLTLSLKSLEGILSFKRISGSFSGTVADIARQIIEKPEVGLVGLVQTTKYMDPTDPNWYYFDLVTEQLLQSDRSSLGLVIQNLTFKNEKVYDALKQLALKAGFNRVEIIWDDETNTHQLVFRNVDRYGRQSIPIFETGDNLASHELKISLDRMFNVIKLNYKHSSTAKTRNIESSQVATKGSQTIAKNDISIYKWGERTREIDVTWELSKEQLQNYADVMLRIFGNLSLDHSFETIGDPTLEIDMGARIIIKSRWGVDKLSDGKFDSYIRIDSVSHTFNSQGFRTSISGKVSSTKRLEEMIVFEDTNVM